MTTSPTVTLDRATVEADLDKTQRHLEDIHQRITIGDQVTGVELAEAEHNLRVAEIRMQTLAEQEATAVHEQHEQRRRDLPEEIREAQSDRDDALRPLIGQVIATVNHFLDAVVEANDRGWDLIAEAEDLGLAKPTGPLIDPYQPLFEAVVQAIDSHGGISLYDPTNSFQGLNDLRPPKGSLARNLVAEANDRKDH